MRATAGQVGLRDEGAPPAGKVAAAGEGREAGAWAGPPTAAGRGDSFGELCLFPEAFGAARRETAVAETWVEAYCLRADRLPEIRAAFPEVVVRLREYCAMRALERDAAAHARPLAASGAAVAVAARMKGLGAQPCRMKKAVEGMRRGLVARIESLVLLPAAGERCSPSFRLLMQAPPSQRLASYGCGDASSGGHFMRLDSEPGLAAQHASQGAEGAAASTEQAAYSALATWLNISCAVSAQGELLYVEHGAITGPARSLGFFLPGRSTYRALEEAEVAQRHGALGGGRQLFGCVVLLFTAGNAPAAGACGQTLELFSRTAADFDAFGNTVVRLLIAAKATEDDISTARPANGEADKGPCPNLDTQNQHTDYGVSLVGVNKDLSNLAKTSAGQTEPAAPLSLSEAAPAVNLAKAAVLENQPEADALIAFATSLFERLQFRLDSHLADIDRRIGMLVNYIPEVDSLPLPPPQQQCHSPLQCINPLPKQMREGVDILGEVLISNQMSLRANVGSEAGGVEYRLPAESKMALSVSRQNGDEIKSCQVLVSFCIHWHPIHDDSTSNPFGPIPYVIYFVNYPDLFYREVLQTILEAIP
jgi:hypothetical protein